MMDALRTFCFYKAARCLAITHIVIGVTFLCIGIDIQKHKSALALFVFTGIWNCVTGGVGIQAFRMERTNHHDFFVRFFVAAAIVSALLGVLIFGFFLAGSDGGIFTFGHQIDAITAFLSTMAVTLGILDLVTGTSAAIIHYKMNSGQYQEGKYTAHSDDAFRYTTTERPSEVSIGGSTNEAGEGYKMATAQATRDQETKPVIALV